MDEVLKVIAIVALTSITVLVIYMIVFFSKTVKILSDASKSIDKIIEIATVLKTRVIITLDEFSDTKNDLKDLKEKTIESLEKWKVTSDKTNEFIESANVLIDTVNNGANKVIETIEPYERLVSRSYDKIAPPIDKVVNIVSAVTKAVEVFSSKLRSKS